MTAREHEVVTGLEHEFLDIDELPHPVGSDPGWAESYLVQAYCPEAAIGVFAHSNRCHFNPALWSEVFAVYLPDDRFVVAKGFGYGRDDTQIGGSLSFEYPRPFVETVTRYSGAAQSLPGKVLRNGPAPSGMHVGLELELSHRALGIPFGIGDLKPGAFGHTHYEQHMAVVGHVTIDGERIALEGTGLRDHTWGPRNISVMANHHWLHGEMPDGRWFSTMIVAARGGGQHLLDFHVIGDQNGMRRAELISPPPLLESDDEVWNSWHVRLRTDDGVEEIEGEILKPMPFTFVGPVEMMLGVDRGSEASHTFYESQTKIRWNGDTGYGLSERSVIRAEQ